MSHALCREERSTGEFYVRKRHDLNYILERLLLLSQVWETILYFCYLYGEVVNVIEAQFYFY